MLNTGGLHWADGPSSKREFFFSPPRYHNRRQFWLLDHLGVVCSTPLGKTRLEELQNSLRECTKVADWKTQAILFPAAVGVQQLTDSQASADLALLCATRPQTIKTMICGS
jgi:hypothetical protein